MTQYSFENCLLNIINDYDLTDSNIEVKRKNNTYVLFFLLTLLTITKKQPGNPCISDLLMNCSSAKDIYIRFFKELNISVNNQESLLQFFHCDNTNFKTQETNQIEAIALFLERYKNNSSEIFILGKKLECLFDKRSSGGIFYTDKSEINFICKLTTFELLKGKLSTEEFQTLIQLNSGQHLNNKSSVTQNIINKITQLNVLDPSCGTGLFLLSYIDYIKELIKVINTHTPVKASITKLLKSTLTNNIYGIDINPLACDLTRYLMLLKYIEITNNTDIKDIISLISSLNNNILCSDFLLPSYSNTYKNILNKHNGFDLIIGNPPYVRQELIGNMDSQSSLIERKTYKNEIIKEIYRNFSDFFDHSKLTINAKSDLYVYFFFKALSLLNKHGRLGFVTSNSWLDADFSHTLKNLLCQNSAILHIIDNKHTRSFEQADVNTVITILSSLNSDNITNPDASLTTLNVPYDFKGINTIINDLLQGKEETLDSSYSVNKIAHNTLQNHNTNYKWGAVYLRAPNIYHIVIEKASNKLVKLKKISKTRFGIKTGANDFFYLDKQAIEKWNIPAEYLKPQLVSLKEVDSYTINKSCCSKYIFCCNQSKEKLRDKGHHSTVEFINQGELAGFNNRPSVNNRELWYQLPEQQKPDFISNRFIGERFGFPIVDNILISDVFFVGRFHNRKQATLNTALVNSTLTYLSAEIYSRKTYGIGVAYLYGPEIKVLDIVNEAIFNNIEATEITNIFNNMKNRPIYKIKDEVLQEDRKQLDSIIFNKLGLTHIEMDDLYDSLINEVSNRLSKAKSVTHKKTKR